MQKGWDYRLSFEEMMLKEMNEMAQKANKERVLRVYYETSDFNR